MNWTRGDCCVVRTVGVESRRSRSWKRLCIGRRGGAVRIRINSVVENTGRERKGRVIDWSGGYLM